MDLFNHNNRCLESHLATSDSARSDIPDCYDHELLLVDIAPIWLFLKSSFPRLDSSHVRVCAALCLTHMVWKEKGMARCIGSSDANRVTSLWSLQLEIFAPVAWIPNHIWHRSGSNSTRNFASRSKSTVTYIHIHTYFRAQCHGHHSVYPTNCFRN